MFGYLPLSFIEEKVRDLENALFFSLSDAVLKLPTCLVKLLEADQIGQLWFIIPRPSQFIHAFDKVFPVKLDFFRKDRDYSLNIIGTAFLVNDPEEIYNAECLHETIKHQATYNETILIKVQMSHAEYVGTTPARISTKSILSQVKDKFFHWFHLSHHEEGMAFQKIPADVKYAPQSSFSN